MRSINPTSIDLNSIEDVTEMPLMVFKDLIGKGKTYKPQISRLAEERNYLKKELAVLTRTTEILSQIC